MALIKSETNPLVAIEVSDALLEAGFTITLGGSPGDMPIVYVRSPLGHRHQLPLVSFHQADVDRVVNQTIVALARQAKWPRIVNREEGIKELNEAMFRERLP